MKIFQLVQKPQRRGAEIFAFQLSEDLQRRQHTVRTTYLYPYQGGEPLPVFPDDYGLPGHEHHPFERMPGVHPALLRRLIRIVDDFAPDIVQVNGARTVKYGAFAKRFSRAQDWRLVYRNIDNPAYWIRDPFRHWFYKQWVMPQIDGVIGVSEATLRQINTFYKLSVPARFIPNGIDSGPLDRAASPEIIRQQMGIDPQETVLLFMGNLTTQKRPDRYLRMLRAIYEQEPTIRGWILGDGVLRADMEALATSLGIGHIVHFWGYQREVASFIAASDLLVVTSDSDGIPAVVLEVGYLGKPVVATAVGGMAECVLDGETGCLIAPEAEDQLAQTVLDLIRNPQSRAVIGDRAKRWIDANFTMDKIGSRYLSFYHDVLAKQ
jgi:glycosyltransferase involved in cell wall biosynthesis